jgi:beta-phosphoglucomutase-like phosphatase (HAD superfamily)
MHPVDAILFEPVGCLAEFPPDEFNAIAERVLARPPSAGKSGSAAYWYVLDLMASGDNPLTASQRAAIQDHELQAVERVEAYEDVAPALSELRDLGVALIVASSLSEAAVARFLEKSSLAGFFTDVWSRETAGGVKDAPLIRAITTRSLRPERALFITDTAEGLQTGKRTEVNAILMMNDPDEAMKLTSYDPAGGIVSLHELPDFVRLVAAENARSGSLQRG